MPTPGLEGRLRGRHLQILEPPWATPAPSLEFPTWDPQEEVGAALHSTHCHHCHATSTLPASHQGGACGGLRLPARIYTPITLTFEGRECVEPCVRSKKGGIPPSKIKCVLQLQGPMGENDSIAECLQSCPRPKGTGHPWPLQSPGSGVVTQTENPASVPADCPHQPGSGSGRELGGRRDFQRPSLLRHNIQVHTPRGPHQGPALELQPYSSLLYKHWCHGDPQRGPLWSVVSGSPEILWLPGRQQRRVPRTGRRVAASQWSLHAGGEKRREEATNCINLGSLLGMVGVLESPHHGHGWWLAAGGAVRQPVWSIQREGRALHQPPLPKSTRLKQSQRAEAEGFLLRGLGKARARLYLSDLTR